MQDPNTGKQLNTSPFGRSMPIGGLSYSFPSGLSRTLNTRGMVLKQGATSDSPAVQSPMGPQTRWTSFLPKRSDKNTLSLRIPSPAPPLNSNDNFVSNYKNANNADTKPYSPNQQTQLEPDLPKAEQRDAKSDPLAQSGSRQWLFLSRNKNTLFSTLPPNSNDQSFSHNNNGNNAPTPSYQKPSNDKTVMTSDDVKRLYGNLIDNGKTKDFIKPMEEKIKEKSSSALPSQQLPATLRPTVEPQMTSTQFREYLKTIPGLKTVPKEVKDEFNKM